MDKWKEFCIDLLFYANKKESVVKLTIMLISWALSIVVLRIQGITDGVGSAYFLLSLSILMEYVEKCSNKRNWIAGFILSLFIFFTVVNLISGVILIIIPNLPSTYISFMFFITVGIAIFWGINLLIVWNINEEDLVAAGQRRNSENFEFEVKTDMGIVDKKKIFEQLLIKGGLGDYREEENNEQ